VRFPWQHRADTEHVHRVAAEQRRDDAQADWPEVRRHADALRKEKELNGWTSTILSIFSSPQERTK
jgi:hypothetical protein